MKKDERYYEYAIITLNRIETRFLVLFNTLNFILSNSAVHNKSMSLNLYDLIY